MNKVYQVVTERIVEQMKKGKIPWKCPWSKISELPKNLKTGTQYRGVNLLMLAFSGYTSPYWLTYRQCQEQGGHVRKGEKGWPVVFWKRLDENGTDDDGDESAYRFVVRYYTAFNVLQCENVEFPQPESRNEDFDPIILCEKIIAEYPSPPEMKDQETRAYYSPQLDTINVPRGQLFDDEENYYATVFHELIHSTGHPHRLNRNTLMESKGFGSDPYCKEELVAELGAAMLCAHAGIDGSIIENSAAYIQHWMEKLKEDPGLIIWAAGKAQKAVDHILSAPPDTNSSS